MKKIITSICCVVLSCTSIAQSKLGDVNAVLKRTSAQYKGMKTIRAQFNIQFEDLKRKTNNIQKAQLVVSGKKFKLELEDQKLYCDGSTLYTYSPEVNEVQIDQYKPEIGEINPANLFTIYESGFTAAFAGQTVIKKKNITLIDLTPTDKKKNYFKIRLWIDTSTNLLQMGKVFQKSGNNITYSITNLGQTPPATEKEFLFDKKAHPGVEVVDMR